jgi:hypothetical protein
MRSPFCLLRLAWALSYGRKPRRKETVLIEANRNCERVSVRAKALLRRRGPEAELEAQGGTEIYPYGAESFCAKFRA